MNYGFVTQHQLSNLGYLEANITSEEMMILVNLIQGAMKVCFLYSLKSKAYRCFNYRTKTIVECANVKVNEKFCTKEKIMDYNSDGDDYLE